MNREDGYKLLQDGAIALARVEANGMRVDVPYLDAEIAKTAARIKRLEIRLRECEEYKLQRRRFGQSVNLTSRDQLASVLFGDMGHTPKTVTATGKAKLDETALELVGTQYTKGFLRLEKLNKLYSTYLTGIRREVEGEFVHCFFGLHLVRSYRGQSDSPNLQNVPVRDPIQGASIRRAFIPRPGCAIIEIDYSSVEVRVACALSGDKKLTYDATEGDMHRDMAAECFLIDKDDVSKPARQAAKGGFVFAEFYGDWYKKVTQNLWDGALRGGIETKSGINLIDNLAKHGITSCGACDPRRDAMPGTFEHHIKAVEDRFWNKRFRVYHAKRQEWVETYKRQGFIDIATGFRCLGPMSRNQVMNYNIQGPAFHCLLWSLIQLQRELKRRKMRSLIIGQIHDSIIGDVPLEEKDEYLALAGEITTRRLRAAWPWVSVPLKVEAEMATTNWYDKAPVPMPE